MEHLSVICYAVCYYTVCYYTVCYYTVCYDAICYDEESPMTGRAPSGAFQPLALARVVSLAEASSFLLLLVATAIKYGAGYPIGVRILGPIHGVLFLTYCALIGYLSMVGRWRRKRTVLALIAAVLPVAPFFVERHWLRGDAVRLGNAEPARPTSKPAGQAG
ncbi:DUF3817 domain-containing protein [Frankia sp. B2]|uniref:DUF3817 domain-containing protein n=1 Tax=Frankia sp. B2 TaxID=2541730 RepID=UPI00106C1592|nr:DUF3817 domain-containing protein [Frankia sp. B2]TFE34771.1 DUF3817 domain-containing protein [Frankia sp. B2]